MWNVGCGVLDVRCWMWNGPCATGMFSHRCHSSGIASLNRINGKGNADNKHCPPVMKTLPFEFQSTVSSTTCGSIIFHMQSACPRSRDFVRP